VQQTRGLVHTNNTEKTQLEKNHSDSRNCMQSKFVSSVTELSYGVLHDRVFFIEKHVA
jgi:hypothetical protein